MKEVDDVEVDEKVIVDDEELVAELVEEAAEEELLDWLPLLEEYALEEELVLVDETVELVGKEVEDVTVEEEKEMEKKKEREKKNE